MRAVRCKNCKNMIPAGANECPNCHADTVDSAIIKISGANKDDFLGICELCGERAIKIEEGEGKTKRIYYRCYECWNSVENTEKRGFFIGKKTRAFGTANEDKRWTKEEANYRRALHKYWLRPLFYKDKTNFIEVEKAAVQVLKTMVSPHQRFILDSYDKDGFNEIG
jgi:hypothetical protein